MKYLRSHLKPKEEPEFETKPLKTEATNDKTSSTVTKILLQETEETAEGEDATENGHEQQVILVLNKEELDATQPRDELEVLVIQAAQEEMVNAIPAQEIIVISDSIAINAGTCFEENIVRKQNKISQLCTIFVVLHNFNGGSQSGCCLHQQVGSLITAANQMGQSILADPH